MNDDATPRIFVDHRSRTTVAIVALVGEEEFPRAQSLIPEWSNYSDYAEWRDSREDLQMGLAMAGVDVRMPKVVLSPFLGWCDDTKTRPNGRALETFAAQSYGLWPVHDQSEHRRFTA